ncbi:hypothetical protein V6N12_024445 [Hibiscus sabdariffa]|uniref:Uncharacterized protein n=1 Tax=Hibiscus sabdariffa TaxID=183260 RepID=A0ABR2G0K9_9ROSI
MTNEKSFIVTLEEQTRVIEHTQQNCPQTQHTRGVRDTSSGASSSRRRPSDTRRAASDNEEDDKEDQAPQRRCNPNMSRCPPRYGIGQQRNH